MLVTCCVPVENTHEPKAKKCSESTVTNRNSPLNYKNFAGNWALQPTPAGRAITSVRPFYQTHEHAFLMASTQAPSEKLQKKSVRAVE